MLIGGPGVDTLDGGGDDDVVIQLVGGDTATSATAADAQWLAAHTRVVGRKTVVEVGDEEHTLPRADLRALIARSHDGLSPETRLTASARAARLRRWPAGASGIAHNPRQGRSDRGAAGGSPGEGGWAWVLPVPIRRPEGLPGGRSSGAIRNWSASSG